VGASRTSGFASRERSAIAMDLKRVLCLPTALIHFLATECRALISFYLSMRSFVSGFAMDDELQRVKEEAATVGSTVIRWDPTCVEGELESILWWPRVSGGASSCYRPGHPGISFVGIFHLLCLVSCLQFLITSLVLFCRSGSSDFRSGTYLAFTWRLEHMKYYNISATVNAVLIVIAFLGVVLNVLGWGLVSQSSQTFWQVCQRRGLGMIFAIVAAWAFRSTYDPALDFNDCRLQRATLKRSFFDLIFQTNDGFADVLEVSVLRARMGHPMDLFDMAGHDLDFALSLLNDPLPGEAAPEQGDELARAEEGTSPASTATPETATAELVPDDARV